MPLPRRREFLPSSDGGDSFHAVNHGFAERPFRSLAASGNEIYLTAPFDGQPGLFRSVDGGATSQSNAAWPRNLRYAALQQGGSGTVFTASSTQVYVSRNGAKTWTALPEFPGGRVLAQAATASGALAGSPTGLFARSSTGAAWKPMSLPAEGPVQELFRGEEGFVAAANDTAIQTSGDDGATWRACSGVPDAKLVFSLSGAGGRVSFVLMGTTSGLLRSEDGRQSWTEVRDGMNADTVVLVTVNPDDPSIALRCSMTGPLFPLTGAQLETTGRRSAARRLSSCASRVGNGGHSVICAVLNPGLMVRTVTAAEAAAGALPEVNQAASQGPTWRAGVPPPRAVFRVVECGLRRRERQPCSDRRARPSPVLNQISHEALSIC